MQNRPGSDKDTGVKYRPIISILECIRNHAKSLLGTKHSGLLLTFDNQPDSTAQLLHLNLCTHEIRPQLDRKVKISKNTLAEVLPRVLLALQW